MLSANPTTQAFKKISKTKCIAGVLAGAATTYTAHIFADKCNYNASDTAVYITANIIVTYVDTKRAIKRNLFGIKPEDEQS